MKMDSIDYNTFKTCKDCSCFSKDKNGYYFGDEKMNIEEVTYKETLDIIKILKRL